MSYDIPTGGKILIDTNIFIFSIMRQLEQGADLSPRETYSRQQAVLAKAFLKHCNNLRTEVCMSYISVCEVLEGIPETFSEETFRLMESTFTLLPFGGTASLLVADFARKLWKLDNIASQINQSYGMICLYWHLPYKLAARHAIHLIP
ncbi:MAG: hypothetical protein K5787_00240 [Lentisphaeria bacterium]|nr:hypothetical protein [Lentisphaeria bacterium]